MAWTINLTFHSEDMRGTQQAFPDEDIQTLQGIMNGCTVSHDNMTITYSITRDDQTQLKQALLPVIQAIGNTFEVIKESDKSIINMELLTESNVFDILQKKPNQRDKNGTGTFSLRNMQAVFLQFGEADLGNTDAIKQQLTTFFTNLNPQTIRVYIPASSGTGHQTTTCNIIRRLIQLGFQQGNIDVVYVANTNNAGKIQGLLPELDIQVNGRDITGVNTPNGLSENVTVSFQNSTAQPETKCTFGISGGVDNEYDDPTGICNVDYFLMLQPFQWNAQNLFYLGNNPINLGTIEALGKTGFMGLTCYYLDNSVFANWNNVNSYLERIPAATPNRAEIINAINCVQTNCCASDTVKLMPVYGLATLAGSQLSNWPDLEQTQALANFLLGVLGAQGTGENQINSPIVVLTLDVYGATWPAALQEKLPQNARNRLTFWEATQNWNDGNITGLANNRVLVLNLPKLLPMPIFNYFYLDASLPPVFEGKGTTPLMLNSGRPYLQLSKAKDGVENIKLKRVTPAPLYKIFLQPSSSPAFYSIGTVNIQAPAAEARSCLEAGNAVVHNTTQNNITVNADTFGVDPAGFGPIQTYLRNNHYINNNNNRVLDKFKALTDADEMEGDPPAGKTKQEIFTGMQTACQIGVAPNQQNICQTYRQNIGNLSQFIQNASQSDSPLFQYFTGLGTHFHNEDNDKLLKGLGFALAAINAQRAHDE
jgi:hypothetical protein